MNYLLDAAPRLGSARIFAGGSVAVFPLNPAAVAVSRYALDNGLWERALSAGADCRQQFEAHAISGYGPFVITTSTGAVTARSVINASGRWSNLRRSALSRRTTDKWIGLKAHFREEQSAESLDLYFFAGGYCGVQPLGTAHINTCAMVRSDAASSVDDVPRLHDALADRSQTWQRVSEAVATSPLIFAPPEPEEGGVLFAGDAAGFIDPFVGDGISLALRSGIMAALSLAHFWRGERSLSEAAAEYRSHYERELRPLFRNSGWLRRLTSIPKSLHRPVMALLRAPGVMSCLVSKTRASPGDLPVI